MSKRILSLSWLATILLLAIFAGFSWVDLILSPAAGGQKIEVTGYLVFPVISALVLLQGSALLAAFFTPALVGRVIALVLTPVVLWHLVVVVSSIQQQLQSAVAAEITKATGVVGASSQAQLVDLALDNNFWYVYVAVLVLNLAVLAMRGILRQKSPEAVKKQVTEEDSGDLWESQR